MKNIKWVIFSINVFIFLVLAYFLFYSDDLPSWIDYLKDAFLGSLATLFWLTFFQKSEEKKWNLVTAIIFTITFVMEIGRKVL